MSFLKSLLSVFRKKSSTPSSVDANQIDLFFSKNYRDVVNADYERSVAKEAGFPVALMRSVHPSVLISRAFAFPLADFVLRWGFTDPQVPNLCGWALQESGWKQDIGSTGMVNLVKIIVEHRKSLTRAEFLAAIQDPSHPVSAEVLPYFLEIVRADFGSTFAEVKIQRISEQLCSWLYQGFDRERFMTPYPPTIA